MIPPHLGLNRQLRRLLDPLLREAAAIPGADRYRKHFPAHSHLQILLFHVLDGAPSLRQTHAKLSGLGIDAVGLAQPISRSQLARSSTSRPLAPVARLFADLVALARANAPRPPRAWGPVRLIDSSFLELSAACSPWRAHGGHVPGVRIHTGFDLAADIPSSLSLTLADTHDARALADACQSRGWCRACPLADTHDARALADTELAPLVGWTLVMDRGYYGHLQFAQLREAGVHFVVRFRDQAHVAVTAERPVLPGDGADVVVTDRIVTLGSPHNHASVVVPALRLITSVNQTGEPLRVVTDRVDLPAATIVQLYRARWRIALFFRWLKHHLGVLHPLGRSPQAIWLSVLLLACVAVLAMLLDPLRPRAVSGIAFLRTLAVLLPHALHSG